MNKDDKIYVAGHRGMVGSAVVRRLQAGGYRDIVTRTHSELDLTSQEQVSAFFRSENIDYVILAAAKVGGIHANNTYPAEFIYQNLMMEANVVHQAWANGVQNLLFLGSSCIYPKLAQQPMREDSLLTGTLEPTNEPYALAKIAGIKLCESYNRQYGTNYRSVMPTNLYGPGDNFDLQNSHVIPALLRKFHEAKQGEQPSVEVWGSGKAKREFLHVDDMADACVFVMELDDETYQSNTQPMLSHINIGTGTDLSIGELAAVIKTVTGYPGEIVFNTDKPDGAPRKLLDVSRLQNMGWTPKIELSAGLQATYDWYCATEEKRLVG